MGGAAGDREDAFGFRGAVCYFRFMSTLVTTDPKELRSILRERLEHCTDEELEAVRKALLQLEINRLVAEMGAEAQTDWDAGKYAPELVEAAISEHRAKHPYR